MTPNKEDYLKCIYELGQNSNKITNKQISESMDVSAPAASEMTKKMIAQELIQKDKERGYILLEKGSRLVSKLYRKHRLIEILLLNHLNYSTDEVHDEAEVLEHVVSDRFIDRLDKMLGYPKECPHGGSIPSPNEPLVEAHQQTLSQIKKLGDYTIVRVRDSHNLLNYMEKYHLTIGTKLQVLEHDTYAGTFTIIANGNTSQITEIIANHIYVD
ncbi:metal-dependent transcriptional regulator [Streptococcus sciuri]|uniref:Manganese transport regulator n=1 Tax=Streptococcus sciuri TaxID=2973939 RepID=A0ABT2F626_9STRE|nr:metal-dependent transcriptional regulator [Streptococcus sciuri]MCS4487908.1 metal-dependent transcriptional regulator [Streptococcus sciuri]